MDRRFLIILAASLAFALTVTLLAPKLPFTSLPDQQPLAARAGQGMAEIVLFMANGIALGFCAGCIALFLCARMLPIPGSDVHQRDGVFECLTLLLPFMGMALSNVVDCIDAVRRSRPELLYLNIPSVMLCTGLAWVKGRQIRKLAPCPAPSGTPRSLNSRSNGDAGR